MTKKLGFILAGAIIIVVAGTLAILRDGPAPPPVHSANVDEADPMIQAAVSETLGQIEQDLGNAGLRIRLAQLYHANGLEDAAEEAYLQAIAMDDEQPRWWHFLALHRSEAGDLEGAIEAGRMTIKLNDSYGSAHRRLGQWSLELGQLAEASSHYDDAERAQPGHPLNAIGSARVRMEQGDDAAAVMMLERVTRNPQFRDIGYAHTLLSRAYRGLGRDDDAARAAARGAGSKQVTDDPWLDDLLAMRTGYAGTINEADRLLATGRTEDAIARLNALRPEHPQDVTLLN
ncbi:MAG: tetratricopeptide repeat protein, partial [Planctomycetota bacterium]